MNIFFLDSDPALAARYHCDQHCVKMTLESAQILSTVHHIYGAPPAGIYKPTHTGHPCVRWTAASVGNYFWLQHLFVELGHQYALRYPPKQHKSIRLLPLLAYPPARLNALDMTLPIQAMPADCRGPDPVLAYRTYYVRHKTFARWKLGEPTWYTQMKQELGS